MHALVLPSSNLHPPPPQYPFPSQFPSNQLRENAAICSGDFLSQSWTCSTENQVPCSTQSSGLPHFSGMLAVSLSPSVRGIGYRTKGIRAIEGQNLSSEMAKLLQKLVLRPLGPLLRAQICQNPFIIIELFVYHSIRKCGRKLVTNCTLESSIPASSSLPASSSSHPPK